MGILDQVLGGAMGGGLGRGAAARKPGLGGTIAAGVILALLVKAARQQARPNPAEGRTFDPNVQHAPAQGGGLGGILGGLGGMLGGGGGLGGILGGLGGAGALGQVVSHMQQRGYGNQVNSWVGPGHNEPIAPDQLADALGDDTVHELEQETGMPRQALLSELAQVLPQAVHEATPAGRLPADHELEQIAAPPHG